MDDVESLLPTWVTVQSFHGFGDCTEVDFCSSSICTAALSKKLHHQVCQVCLGFKEEFSKKLHHQVCQVCMGMKDEELHTVGHVHDVVYGFPQ